ncbi:multidrug effflux MFS transporter [Rubrivirga sp. S365]|uniref:multidrug effflux MFS transporter n=1 Tax=Rubrivirga sp. S365 TaxID=3076080 RepID=UPI0028C5A0E9|nr:multidrug effflux MFS transporter [Rubrivirga sp. S365]MDT7858351.1 multidrug effflux MFS transporter [Rubrivirga sp. S365]
MVTILVLALLSAVAPLATDMYLPGFPQMAEDLATNAASVQLTLTSFMIGLAGGQLVIGPLSDRFGRRRPLLIGTALAILAGALCVVAPNIETLIALRTVQGFGGAAGVVLARSIISDRTDDETVTARLFQVMTMIGGLAPVLAPSAGTGIVAVAGWRGVFAVITGLSILSFVGVVRFIGESLPREQRSDAGLGPLWDSIRQLLGNREYVGYTLVAGFSFMALYGYISASPFVFQTVLGLTPTEFSIAFGTNAAGMMASAALSARLVSRIGPRRQTGFGLVLLLAASFALMACVLAGAGPMWVLPAVFLTLASVGLILGNASALAILRAPLFAGTASAVLGAAQFGLGALVSPLVGLGGEEDPVPMAIAIVAAALLASACFWLLTKAETAPTSPATSPPQSL